LVRLERGYAATREEAMADLKGAVGRLIHVRFAPPREPSGTTFSAVQLFRLAKPIRDVRLTPQKWTLIGGSRGSIGYPF
jgi:hypothetical protein